MLTQLTIHGIILAKWQKPVAGKALKALCLLINTDPLIKGLFLFQIIPETEIHPVRGKWHGSFLWDKTDAKIN